ncbi:response regulator [Legionella sp. 16cNR16C]|uniref:response regulator n=1 Tax=Legionella sp. 16cNR16C TaxID=2905656 RepID=UPI001E301D61|nr:response regulator [Legionella sp. 16cNR16C]MCE3045436.1 response regulator [Legionella sp. 16cNR16C]
MSNPKDLEDYPFPALISTREGLIEYCNPAFIQAIGPYTHQFLQTISGLSPLSTPLLNERATREPMPLTIHGDMHLQWVVYPYQAVWIAQSQPVNTLIEAIEKGKLLQMSIIDLLPNFTIFWKNKDLVYLGCNQTMAHAMGLPSSNAIIGKTDFDLPTPKIQSEAYRRDDQDIIQSGKAKLNIEEVQTLPGQGTRVLLTSKVPLFDVNGKVDGVLAIYTDITEQKQLQHSLQDAKEKAEAASLAKTEFLENMRHDIRTPLTGIVGFADILKMESQTPHLKEYADNLVASSHALLELLDEILEAIRVSSGEIPMLRKKFNLKDSLQHIIELNRSKAAHKRLSLQLDYDARMPLYFIGDKIRIHRIVLELVANALNFTDTGFVNVTVTLAKQTGRDLIAQIVVDDSGMGIPKEKQQEIYLQFKRLTPSYQGIYKGAGLGLSVVKQFIDELEGEIYVKSEPRKGSRFTCLIPLKESLMADDSGIEGSMEETLDELYSKTYAQEIKPLQGTHFSGEHRVLVVEDNVIAQTVAKSMLSALHCLVDIADTGRNALALWKANPYDLIFMDIGLPDLDGYEVTHAIRVQELAQKAHVPIIALTAHAGDENKKRCIDAGMNAVLTKPLTAKNCADMVNAFIPGRQKDLPPQSACTSEEGLPPSLTEFPLLDIAEGMKTLGDEASVAEMLRFMIKESLPEDLQKLTLAHQANDWEKTEQLIHKIKGGAVYVGTIQLKMACQYFDQYWKSGETEQLESLFQQAVTVAVATTQAIEDWLKEQTS